MGETYAYFKVYGTDDKSVKLEAVVDTGSTFTKVPKIITTALGLRVKNKAQAELGNGEVTTRRLTLTGGRNARCEKTCLG